MTPPPRREIEARRPARAPIRERLLDAAEREFALHGYGGASLRRITERAQVALGNVSHIFGGKRELLGAVYERLFEPLTRQRLESLDELLRRTSSPTPIEVFDATFGPVIEFLTHPQGAQRGLFSLRGVFEHEVFWPHMKKTGEQILERFTDAYALALPSVPRDEVMARWAYASRLLHQGLTPGFQNVDDPHPISDEEIRRARNYAITILTVPVDAPTPD